MSILITNDDGISAIGIQTLESAIKNITDDIIVLAPKTEQSAKSHSLTMHRPVVVEQISDNRYNLDGTPADCVRASLKALFKDKINLVVSGINNGLNVSTDMYYSGTVGAAREAIIHGKHAIAFSMQVSKDKKDFERAALIAKDIVSKVYKLIQTDDTLNKKPLFLNVNIPNKVPKAIKVTNAKKLFYRENCQIKNLGNNLKEISYKSVEINHNGDDNTDYCVVNDGYVSMTSVSIDFMKPDVYDDSFLTKIFL